MGELNHEYDLVVVGAGNAALCSAIAAKENGANVLVLERGKKQKRGGNSFFTDGAIRFAYEDLDGIRSVLPNLESQNIDMPTYTEDDYYRDIMRVTENKSDSELARQLVSKSFETIQWMVKQGVEFELNENQSFERNGKLQFWGGLPVRAHRKGIGLIETLIQKAEAMDIEIRYDTRAEKLEMSEGKINSIIAIEAGIQKVIPTKAVILACGGFEANKEKRKKYLGLEWEKAVVRGSEYNTGDGIDMALEVGAQSYGDWSGCHAHTTDFNAPSAGDYNKPGDIYKKSSYPLGIIVNNQGKRFVDEGADFRNYTYAKYGKETLRQPEQKAYQLYDQQVYHMLRQEYKLEEATCIKADSVEELAEKMQVNKNNLVTTINEYNRGVQEGDYNPSVKDGKGTLGITPPKSNWALRLEQAPYYAYPITCGITFTFGGVRANKYGEILDHNGSAIPGLFGAGEMIGGIFYHNYPGGSGLMSGAVFGKLAGESAASYVSDTERVVNNS